MCNARPLAARKVPKKNKCSGSVYGGGGNFLRTSAAVVVVEAANGPKQFPRISFWAGIQEEEKELL